MKKDGGVITNWQLHSLSSDYLVEYPGTGAANPYSPELTC